MSIEGENIKNNNSLYNLNIFLIAKRQKKVYNRVQSFKKKLLK